MTTATGITMSMIVNHGVTLATQLARGKWVAANVGSGASSAAIPQVVVAADFRQPLLECQTVGVEVLVTGVGVPPVGLPRGVSLLL